MNKQQAQEKRKVLEKQLSTFVNGKPSLAKSIKEEIAKLREIEKGGENETSKPSVKPVKKGEPTKKVKEKVAKPVKPAKEPKVKSTGGALLKRGDKAKFFLKKAGKEVTGEVMSANINKGIYYIKLKDGSMAYPALSKTVAA